MLPVCCGAQKRSPDGESALGQSFELGHDERPVGLVLAANPYAGPGREIRGIYRKPQRYTGVLGDEKVERARIGDRVFDEHLHMAFEHHLHLLLARRWPLNRAAGSGGGAPAGRHQGRDARERKKN